MRFATPSLDSEDEEDYIEPDTPTPTKVSRPGARFSAFDNPLDSDSDIDSPSGSQSDDASSSEEDAWSQAKAGIHPTTPTPVSLNGMGSYRKRETLKLGKEKGNGSVLGSSYEKSEVKNRQRGPYAGTSGDRDSKGKGKKQIGSLSKKEGQKERSKSGSGKRVESGRFVVSVDEWARWEMASKQSAILKAHAMSQTFRLSLSSPPPAYKSSSPFGPLTKEYILSKFNEDQAARELEDVRRMLEGLEMERRDEERKAQEEFEIRNRDLWRNIESSIKAAEEAEAKRQADLARQAKEQEALRTKLLQQAQARAAVTLAEKEKASKAEAAKIDAARKAEEAKKLKDDVKKAEAAEAAKRERDRQAGQGITSGLSVKKKEWMGWAEKHREVKRDVIREFKKNPTNKKDMRSPLATIRSKVGQLTNNREKILSVIGDIHSALQTSVGDTLPISFSQPLTRNRNPPMHYLYLLSHLSKCLLKQAEAEIQPAPDAAYKLAKVVMGLFLLGHTLLGETLMARLVKKTPFVVPYYPAREKDQPEDEYRKSVGQKIGEAEDEVQFSLRMSAILRLYLAIIGTDIRVLSEAVLGSSIADFSVFEQHIPPCFRLSAGWSWLAGILREPMPGYNPTPQLLIAALETMGKELTDAYGAPQMGKIIVAILRDGLGVDMATGQQQAVGSLAPDNNSAREQLKILLEPLTVTGEFADVAAKRWELD